MDIGIGIPNTVPGMSGAQLLDWARRAEAAGFSSLASIGAVSYPSYEELTVFAATGAVTERIRFLSNVLIAPARSTAELAKQAATVDQLTGGRLTLGLGVGWRATDYQLTGRDFDDRGRRFDQQLRDLRRAWARGAARRRHQGGRTSSGATARRAAGDRRDGRCQHPAGRGVRLGVDRRRPATRRGRSHGRESPDGVE